MTKAYRTESWLHPDLYVGPSVIDGNGVYSRSPLSRGDVIAIWGGKVFTREDVDAGRAKDHTMVAVDDGVFLGSEPQDDYTSDDFMNHSCSPNIGMKDEVTLVTRSEIPIGVELTADYSLWLDNPSYVMKKRCNCRTSGCRTMVTGRDWRLAIVQSRNRGYFSPFLRRRIARMNLSGDSTMNVLVTGGSRGIGNAIAADLVAAGHKVLIVGRNKETLDHAVSGLARGALEVPLACEGDVSSEADRTRLTRYCTETGFMPEVLVLNAGTFIEGTLMESNPESYFGTMTVNLDACYHLVQAFGPAMSARGRGRVILIGSTAAYEPYPLGPLYGVSKWALRGFAVNLRRELMHKGVGVTFVAPGGTFTDLWAGEKLSDDRLMLPSDVGRLVRTILELSPQAVVEEVIFRPMLGDIHE